MSILKSDYTKALAKQAALEDQQKTVTAKLNGITLKRQPAQKACDEAAEQVEAVRGNVMRGIAVDDDLAAAEQAALAAQSVVDGLRDDEQACRKAIQHISHELGEARTATVAALQSYCYDIAERLGNNLARDKNLRSSLVDIFVAYRATMDRSLGGTIGGNVNWPGVLEGLFTLPTDAEFEVAYDRFKSQLR